uniref:hypothetical protein n=1 Tax=Neisseria subflava TaxID=28449 RepID=UPI000D30A502
WEVVDVFGDHGLCGLPEEGAHGKSPKCLSRNLGDFGEFCKGLSLNTIQIKQYRPYAGYVYFLVTLINI